jgi:hypothetical protein
MEHQISANTKLGGSDDPDGLPEEPASRDHPQEAQTWDTALTSERPPCMNCLVKFLIGRRVYLAVMIGVSIALGLAALLPASAQTTAVHAAHTPARLGARPVQALC